MKAIKFKLKDGSMSEEIKGVTMLESSDLYPAFPEQLYHDLDSSNSALPKGDAKLTEGDQLSDKIAPRSFASLQLRAKNAMRSLFALKRERMLVMCTGRLIDPLATAYDMVKEVSGIEAVIAYAPTKFELFGNDKEDGILTANYCLMSASGASVKLAGQARKSNRVTRICDEGLFTTKQVTAAVVEEDASEQNNDSKDQGKDDHKVVLTSLTSACQDGLFEAGTLAAASGQDDSHERDAKSSECADKAACSQGKANYNVIIMPCVHLIEHSKWLGMIDACLAENDALKLILVGDATDVAQLSLLWSTLDSAIHTDVVLEFPVVGALHTLGGLINHYRLNDRSGSDLLPFSRDALALLAAYSCRISGDRRYLGLTELSLKSLIYEANRFALRNLKDVQCPEAKENAADSQDHVSCSFVSRYHVLKAIAALDFRNNFLAESVLREHRDRQLLISTQGAVVGQINGLSVIETLGTSYEYGEPVRITATLRAGGEGDVIDIERKAELAGQIHAKAMMIINGFLTKEFGSEQPLPVSASLVFEQSYSEVDGDSASLTGLCAVISVLAGLPIRQGLAVTGAVDQFGDVQAVGGVNEKIEGFYRVCRLHGLTGEQGVIIPSSCVNQLVLRPAVVKAVAEGKFHIFTVSHVTEAVKMLTTVDWGDAETENTVCYRISERLNNVIAGAQEQTWYEELTEKVKDAFAKLTGKSESKDDKDDKAAK